METKMTYDERALAIAALQQGSLRLWQMADVLETVSKQALQLAPLCRLLSAQLKITSQAGEAQQAATPSPSPEPNAAQVTIARLTRELDEANQYARILRETIECGGAIPEPTPNLARGDAGRVAGKPRRKPGKDVQ